MAQPLLGATLFLLAGLHCSASPMESAGASGKPDLEKIKAFKARFQNGVSGLALPAAVPGSSKNSSQSNVEENPTTAKTPEISGHSTKKAEAIAEQMEGFKDRVATQILDNVERGVGDMAGQIGAAAKAYVKKALKNITEENANDPPPSFLVNPVGNVHAFTDKIKNLIGGIKSGLKHGAHEASKMAQPDRLMDFMSKFRGKQDGDTDEEDDVEAKDEGEEAEAEAAAPTLNLSAGTDPTQPASFLAMQAHLRGRGSRT